MCPAVQYLVTCHARYLDEMCELTGFFYLHSLSVYLTLSFKGTVYMAAKRCVTTVSRESLGGADSSTFAVSSIHQIAENFQNYKNLDQTERYRRGLSQINLKQN